MSDLEPLPKRVYRLLSDGQFHSGTQLAADCRVSRNATWKAIAALRALGVTVHAVPNRGYRLPAATGLLERGQIVKLYPAGSPPRWPPGCAPGSASGAQVQPTAISCSAKPHQLGTSTS